MVVSRQPAEIGFQNWPHHHAVACAISRGGLLRLAWRVLLVVWWLSCRGGVVWMGMPLHRWQWPPSEPRWVWRSRCNSPSMVVIIVCGCVTNCVTITTYHDGLPGILGDA